jgi:hypothetical protein
MKKTMFFSAAGRRLQMAIDRRNRYVFFIVEGVDREFSGSDLLRGDG